MKNLTDKELQDAPATIKFLYWSAKSDIYISSQMLEEAMRDYPEYFPEEIEYKRKWALIPQSVHDAYWLERHKQIEDIYKDMPPNKGIIGWASDKSGNDYNIWNDTYKKLREIEKPLAEALHKKYYSQYGIDFNGW